MPRAAEYALDASAVLALVQNELGAAEVARLLTESYLSAVNLAEVIAVLRRRGVPAPEVDDTLDSLRLPVISFHPLQARMTADLIGQTRAAGLSFGDCACLALGQHCRLTVVTAEKAWAKLNLGIPVQVIR
jgi:ribonuclease VapC